MHSALYLKYWIKISGNWNENLSTFFWRRWHKIATKSLHSDEIISRGSDIRRGRKIRRLAHRVTLIVYFLSGFYTIMFEALYQPWIMVNLMRYLTQNVLIGRFDSSLIKVSPFAFVSSLHFLLKLCWCYFRLITSWLENNLREDVRRRRRRRWIDTEIRK